MNEQYPLPDPEKVKQTVAKLRQTRLELQEFGIELEEIIALLEKNIREQRLKRIQKSKEILS
ncbi:hypothetical protein C7H19_13485 [Aphanothece hegewaldii CCALA 016]|uniref:Uncharacterized protein n=1 Tax=Aphanothece hegewaldii CCALA 016 TaxID=2107694 RepID=A0A2T1LWE9_9CHRO|nr:hypothetical protein [Aphanothece hegewaldii]PSF36220.1 hypothetical protein C7H19_13485 [Aphanothece hegewaldii CCALA 016]